MLIGQVLCVYMSHIHSPPPREAFVHESQLLSASTWPDPEETVPTSLHLLAFQLGHRSARQAFSVLGLGRWLQRSSSILVWFW